MAKRKSLATLFLELAEPDAAGFSRMVPMEELVAADSRFLTTNGGSWCRSDSGLGAKYNIHRPIERGRIAGVQLMGLKTTPLDRGIREDIARVIRARKCAILVMSNDIQVDHKDGRYTDPRVMNQQSQALSDFQALSRAANSAKRGHCRDCKETGVRFDARILGYSHSQWIGEPEYNGTCVGCFWYDPFEFNARVSRDFKPGDQRS